MADATWGEEVASAPPKKSIPTWVWFCGAGCLAMLVLGLAVVFIGVNFFKNATDPEKQWEAIAQILPYDERPTEMVPNFGMKMGVEQYVLRDSRGYELQLQHYTGDQARETREALFEKDPPQIPKEMVVVGFKDLKASKVDVQGREIPIVRLRMEFEGIMKKMVPKKGQDQLGAMLWADVTPEGRDDLVFLQMRRNTLAGGTAAATDPISDDELRALLKPFRIGPKH